MKHELEQERSAKVAAQDDLDALKNKTPDTSEADALRLEVKSLKDQLQLSLVKSQEELSKTTEELLATKNSLSKAEAEAAAHEAAAEAKYQTSMAELKDKNDSLMGLVKAADQKAADMEALVEDLKANLNAKDAEIAELKVTLFYPFMHSLTCSQTLDQGCFCYHTRKRNRSSH